MPHPDRGAVRAAVHATFMSGAIAMLALHAAPARADTGSTADEIAALRKELRAQQDITRRLARRLDNLSATQHNAQAATQQEIQHALAASKAAQEAAVRSLTAANTANQTEAGIQAGFKTGMAPRGISGYKSGFYVSDDSGDNSLYINGLLQPRYRFFQPSGTTKFGAKDQASSNFDIFLARLYFSGSLIDPSLTYFFTLQGTTQGAGSAPGIVLLDAELAKEFNPYFKVEMGRYWSAYTYEYYLDIGKYMFPDLSAAEWAFSLGRQLGVRVSGKAGDFTYRVSVSNPVPGSTSGATENTTTKLAVIGNVLWDILAPYGYVETDPDPHAAPKPQLSLWASAMYNPVQNGSRVYNDVQGDNTGGATASLNFRDGPVSFQGSGYYKHTDARGPNAFNDGHPGYDSFGWQEQAGVYLIPGLLEAAERIDGITWGYRQTGPVVADAASDTQWYAGPDNFGWQRMTEYTADLNYYLHGHNAKAQLAYSYMRGSTFSHEPFSANRVILQTQLGF
jgi:hypothetical protein